MLAIKRTALCNSFLVIKYKNRTIGKNNPTNVIDENSIYQLALADLRARKAEYLSYRNELALKDPESLTEEMKQHLADLEAALDAAEDALMTHSEYAHRMLDEVKAQMTTAYNQLLSLFEDIDMTALADEISQKQTAALDVFFTEFETRYAGAKEAAKQNWNKMALGISRKEQ